jgi:hypothetical protein
VYSLELTGDGHVLFEGRAHVDSAGRYFGRIPTERLAALVLAFEEAGYFSLAEQYTWGTPGCSPYAADAPTVVTSITIGRRAKRIEHDLGCADVPPQLTQLERRIDETAESWRWTGRRREAARERELVDFPPDHKTAKPS